MLIFCQLKVGQLFVWHVWDPSVGPQRVTGICVKQDYHITKHWIITLLF